MRADRGQGAAAARLERDAGAVSLAAALALPLDFPLRDLILFLTFSVILVTLVVQGLTLPALIRRLRFEEDDSEEREEVQARLAATHAALDRLEELAGEDWTRDDTVQRLRACSSSAAGA